MTQTYSMTSELYLEFEQSLKGTYVPQFSHLLHADAHPLQVKMVERYISGRRQFNWYNLLIIIAVSFGSMSYGYASSAIAPILAQPTFLQYFKLDTRPNGTSPESTFNGLLRLEISSGSSWLVELLIGTGGRRV